MPPILGIICDKAQTDIPCVKGNQHALPSLYGGIVNKASLQRKEGFLTERTSLVCSVRKPSLKRSECENVRSNRKFLTGSLFREPSRYSSVTGKAEMRRRADPMGTRVMSSSVAALGASSQGSTPQSFVSSRVHEGMRRPFALNV